MIASENDNDWRPATVQTENSGIKAVGIWLKAARELKGETLNDISRTTRIGKHYLEAIEEGCSSKLPSQAYTRAFVRLYAAHLGLSPDEALTILDRSSLNSSPEISTTEDASATGKIPLATESQASPKRNKQLLLVVLSLCIAATQFFFFPSRKTEPPENAPQPATKSSASEVNTQQSPADIPATKSSSAPIAAGATDRSAPDGIVLRLKAVRDGKLHITIDGAISQEYDLAAGDIVEWKAEKVFLLDVENAASVEGELNGAPLKPFGEQGQPAHMLISADGARRE